ncbi:MAG: terminase family protein, partial [Clostridia bacterium]|nr:terminase family protein [Clostridia bacterium]
MSEPITLEITPLQHRFMTAAEDEVLFGGAAGGGKSFGQLADALRYALCYPGSRQLLLRRTLPELESSLIRTAQELFPAALYHYISSRHTGVFVNGSVLDFGYCDSERDALRYQSTEYDVIRFDELTHFTEGMYLYLMSRLRGSTPYPRQMKSTTNPGGIGHDWVKRRFIDPAPPDTPIEDGLGS